MTPDEIRRAAVQRLELERAGLTSPRALAELIADLSRQLALAESRGQAETQRADYWQLRATNLEQQLPGRQRLRSVGSGEPA